MDHVDMIKLNRDAIEAIVDVLEKERFISKQKKEQILDKGKKE